MWELASVVGQKGLGRISPSKGLHEHFSAYERSRWRDDEADDAPG